MKLLLVIVSLTVLGSACAIVQRWTLARSKRLRFLPLWLAGVTIGGAFVASLGTPSAAFDILLDLRPGSFQEHLAVLPMWWSGLLCTGAVMICAMAFWERLLRFGQRDAQEALTRLAPLVLVSLPIIGLLAQTEPVGVRTDRPPAEHEFDLIGLAMLAAVMVLIGLNASGLAVALYQRGAERLASMTVAVINTFIAVLIGATLHQIAVVRLNLPAAIGRFMVPTVDADAYPADARSWVGWALAYIVAVAATTMGGMIGLWIDSSPVDKLDRGAVGRWLGGVWRSQRRQVLAMPVWSLWSRRLRSKIPRPPSAPHPQTPAPSLINVMTFPRRWHYALAAVLSVLAAWYGSLVPVEYTAMPWGEALAQFAEVKYLNIGLDRRADWTANLMLFVPLGFFAMATVDVDRPVRVWGWLAAPVIVVLLIALAAAMEFSQLWFPPRTVSQNDMIAASIGAMAGVTCWLSFGRPLTRVIRSFVFEQMHHRLVARALYFYVAVLILYSLLPFDFVMTGEDLRRKLVAGRVVPIPFSRPYGGALVMAGHLLRDLVLFAPVGIAARLGWDGLIRRSARQGTMVAVLIAAGTELAALFVFTNYTDVTDVIVRGIAGGLGAVLTTRVVGPNAMRVWGFLLPRATRVICAAALLLAYTCFVAAILWHPYHFGGTAADISVALSRFIDYPFRYYYYTGEWTVMTIITHLVLLFVPVGVILRWAAGAVPRRGSWITAMLAVVPLALCIEFGQVFARREKVYLSPAQVANTPSHGPYQAIDVTDPNLSKGMEVERGPRPDITDFGAYLLGAGLGWVAAGLLLPRRWPEICAVCDHDLRGTLAAGRTSCPECGAAITAVETPAA